MCTAVTQRRDGMRVSQHFRDMFRIVGRRNVNQIVAVVAEKIVIQPFRRFTILALFAMTAQATANFDGWLINEIYSNADGSIQFIELSQEQVGGKRPKASIPE